MIENQSQCTMGFQSRRTQPKKNNDDPAGHSDKKTKSDRGFKFVEKEKGGKGRVKRTVLTSGSEKESRTNK
jgi:hypothetical protein